MGDRDRAAGTGASDGWAAYAGAPVGCAPLIFLLGFLFLVIGLGSIRYWHTAHWRTAPGKILDVTGDGPQKQGQYFVMVSYRFVVNGQEYDGDTLNLDDQPSSS